MLLNRAIDDLEREKQDRDEEKKRYLQEKLPPLQLSGLSLEELQVTDKTQFSFFKLFSWETWNLSFDRTTKPVVVVVYTTTGFKK